MGYEIVFHYCEKIDGQNEYDKEAMQTRKVKIGDPYEEVALEQVAGKVMAQLARRNIWVEDVEIYEIVKKKISYKETPDGILIKNRKFSFDGGAVTSGDATASTEIVDDQTAKLLQLIAADPNILQKLGVKAPVQSQVKPVSAQATPLPLGTKILRHEIFDPNTKDMAQDAAARGYAFTIGKKYPIFSERAASPDIPELGMFYRTMDDKGVQRVLSDKFFSPDVKLTVFGADEFNPSSEKEPVESMQAIR